MFFLFKKPSIVNIVHDWVLQWETFTSIYLLTFKVLAPSHWNALVKYRSVAGAMYQPGFYCSARGAAERRFHFDKILEFFLNCQIWHFCHSCTKLTSQGFRISKKKITSTGYWTPNTNPTLRFPAPLTTQPPRHLLNRRFMNWTLIISGLIEHDFKRVWKFEAGMDWQIGWVGKGAGILIVGLVLWVQYPVEAIFFADFETPWCQFCTRMTEMSDLAIEEKLD